MTYNVFGGTLSLTQSIIKQLISLHKMTYYVSTYGILSYMYIVSE